MKKLLLFAVLLISAPLLGMEEKKLTKEEAGKIYWNSVNALSNETMPYAEYRANLIRAIPSLGYTQHHYHNPLSLAVKGRDYEFAEFLLQHGADPLARDMSNRTAIDVVEEKGGLYQPGVVQQGTTEEEDEISKNLLRNLLKSYLP